MSASLLAKGAHLSGLTLWVLTTFIGAQFIAATVILIPLFENTNDSVLALALAAVAYVLATVFVIGLPAVLLHKRTSARTLGLARHVAWKDIGLAVLSVVPYYIAMGLFVLVLNKVLPVVDPTVEQVIPFKDLVFKYEYFIAFVTLVVLAPIAEEVMFRGYFLGKAKEIVPAWLAVLVTSLIFAALHLFGGEQLQWAVAADTFILGLILGCLRIVSGSIWAGILLHMIKNGISFFFLFIYPGLAGTM